MTEYFLTNPLWRTGVLWLSKTCISPLLDLTGCRRNCNTCFHSTEKTLHAHNNKTTRNIYGHIICTTSNLNLHNNLHKMLPTVYWRNRTKLKYRIIEHISNIRNNTCRVTGTHFNSSGDTINHIHVSVIESLHKSTEYHKIKELFWINKLQTFRFGLHKKTTSNFLFCCLIHFLLNFLFYLLFSYTFSFLGWVNQLYLRIQY